MGGFVIALANSQSMTGGTAAQDAAARGLTSAFLTVERWLAPLPEVLLGLGLLAVAVGFVWFTLADRRRRPGAPVDAANAAAEHPSPAPDDAAPSCHDPAASTPHEHEQNRTAR